jgi:hypothetical protein
VKDIELVVSRVPKFLVQIIDVSKAIIHYQKTVIGYDLSATVHLKPLRDRISTTVQNLNRC